MLPQKMNQADLTVYLKRICYEKQPEISLACLMDMTRLHTQNIIYENFSALIKAKNQQASLFQSVILNQFGICFFEGNLLYASFLRTLGFRVFIHQAKVYSQQVPHTKLELQNHHILSIQLNEQRFLVDVSFPFGPQAPIEICKRQITSCPESKFRLTPSGQGFLLEKLEKYEWQPIYRFNQDLRPDDELACIYHLILQQRSLSKSAEPLFCSKHEQTTSYWIYDSCFFQRSQFSQIEKQIHNMNELIYYIKSIFQLPISQPQMLHTHQQIKLRA